MRYVTTKPIKTHWALPCPCHSNPARLNLTNTCYSPAISSTCLQKTTNASFMPICFSSLTPLPLKAPTRSQAKTPIIHGWSFQSWFTPTAAAFSALDKLKNAAMKTCPLCLLPKWIAQIFECSAIFAKTMAYFSRIVSSKRSNWLWNWNWLR